MNLAYEAMMFAREVHKDQRRRYTNDPYVIHLAEVAGIVAAANVFTGTTDLPRDRERVIAVAWLHDCVEDRGVMFSTVLDRFDGYVLDGVMRLSDIETGNRAARKAAARERLAGACGWVQSIKCADLISNTASIIQHDPKFAVTYIEEARLLLGVMTKADPRLRALALAGVGAEPIAGLSSGARSDEKTPNSAEGA